MKPSPASLPSAEDSIVIDTNRRLLNRYRFVAQESMHILAGWLPTTRRFELKCEFGREIWESSLHVNAYYLRLREIQSPAFQKPDDPTLLHLMAELLHAPDEFAVALTFGRVLIPDIIRSLRNHEQATFPNSDQPSVHAIRHALLDLEAQADRLDQLLTAAETEGAISSEALTWSQYITACLQAAGGIDGQSARTASSPAVPSCRRDFELPVEAKRDDRFVNPGAATGPISDEEDHISHTIEEFERYSTEMLAAETVAVVMFQLPDMPWEFHRDAARHLYDEVRHCLMGFEWMQRHERDPFLSPQYLHVFRWRCQFPPVTQYCLLTMGNEVHAFPYRHRRVEAHQNARDILSEQFVRYDIADETQHVRFGKRWLPELLQHIGEPRSLETFTKDVMQVWEKEYKTGKLTVSVE